MWLTRVWAGLNPQENPQGYVDYGDHILKYTFALGGGSQIIGHRVSLEAIFKNIIKRLALVTLGGH